MSRERHAVQLRRKLDSHFNEEELRTLCFDLNIDYDNLGGRTKANKARELVAASERNDRFADLIAHCQRHRPDVVWTYQTRLFVCYKRHAATDKQLADYLFRFLTEAGHDVFIDRSMRTGTAWLEEIDRQIREADFLVVLLSQESADSEMVQAEVQRAFNYQRHQGHPHILPVRVSYRGLLPYTIDAFLNPLQYVSWSSPADNERLGREILAAIDGDLPPQQAVASGWPTADATTPITISEDGQPMRDDMSAPLPEFDPRFLDELSVPGGAVRLRDKFYVERKADADLRRQNERRGSITTILAPRQMGKSSLLVRGVHHAREQGSRVVMVDLQRVDRDDLQTIDSFLRYVAHSLARRLRLPAETVDNAWQQSWGTQDKLTYLMEDLILPGDKPLLLAIDEADRLLETDYHTDVFGLIRAWHNSAAYDPLWENLNIAMVISTEPYLLIADANQSPFNVGLKLDLEDFTPEQVANLNQRHRSPVATQDLPALMSLLQGHPYLTRKALYFLVKESRSWAQLEQIAATDGGPFSDHLRRHLWLLRDDPELQSALREVIDHNRCTNDSARYRLQRAGLIHAKGDRCRCRCELYRRYFQEKL